MLVENESIRPDNNGLYDHINQKYIKYTYVFSVYDQNIVNWFIKIKSKAIRDRITYNTSYKITKINRVFNKTEMTIHLYLIPGESFYFEDYFHFDTVRNRRPLNIVDNNISKTLRKCQLQEKTAVMMYLKKVKE